MQRNTEAYKEVLSKTARQNFSFHKMPSVEKIMPYNKALL